MSKCSKCGAELAENAKFCNECGNPVSTSKTCPKCNSEQPTSAKFCNCCGNKFVNNTEDKRAIDKEKSEQLLSLLESRNYTFDSVRKLIDEGADVNAKDSDGWTPLYSASRNDDSECVKLLIEHGADVNVRTYDGRTPLHGICFIAGDDVDALSLASVLIEAGADVNAKDESGNTPLHVLANCSENREKTMLALIEHGADINAQNNDGDTPLHLSGRGSYHAKVLIEAGAALISNNMGVAPIGFYRGTYEDLLRATSKSWGIELKEEKPSFWSKLFR